MEKVYTAEKYPHLSPGERSNLKWAHRATDQPFWNWEFWMYFILEFIIFALIFAVLEFYERPEPVKSSEVWRLIAFALLAALGIAVGYRIVIKWQARKTIKKLEKKEGPTTKLA